MDRRIRTKGRRKPRLGIGGDITRMICSIPAPLCIPPLDGIRPWCILRKAICFPGNLLKNPGFETGDLTYWDYAYDPCIDVKATTDSAHEGRYGLSISYVNCLEGDYEYVDLNQVTIQLTPGKRVKLSMWIHPRSMESDYVELFIGYYDRGGNFLKEDIMQWEFGDLEKGWQEIVLESAVPADTYDADVDIYIRGINSGADPSISMDHVSFSEV